ncbi:MAG: nucleoside triphosphate pyrophosphohydrolase [Cyanobacteria bacterium P01_H01_bin.15]
MDFDLNTAISSSLERLIKIVAQLRSPEGGCPWDLAQTPQTLIPYVIEEAYEVVDALRRGAQDDIVEELGDLLLQVVLQSQISSEAGEFDLGNVATGISDKLVRRHPHVFGGIVAQTPDEVRENWEIIKATEKGENSEQIQQRLTVKLQEYARVFPPLLASHKISVKAAKAGFEWPNVEEVWDKFSEELAEFKEALQTEDKAHQEAELGDLLFTIVNLARWYDLDCNAGLQGTNQRLIARMTKMEDTVERPLSEYSIEELENLWQTAKKELSQQQKN